MQYPDNLKGGFDTSQHQNAVTEVRRGLKLGSLCTGYGGLDIAVQKVFGAVLSWVADSDRHISKLLAARLPGVPNLGDITRIDWGHVERVDILCAGFPCQDISYAGLGAGIAHCVRNA